MLEQYEPFFDQGFDYKRPSDSPKRPITEMFYDPRGQVVKTINPDDTEQRVIFGIPRSLSTPDQYTPTPWESYTYDPNDLGGITHSTESAGYSNHWHTPTSAVVDALGRTVKTTEHKSHDTDPHGSGTIEDVVMKYEYDIRGNLTKVTDAKDRKAFAYKHSLRPTKEDEQGEVIEAYQIDSGTSTVIYNANGQPVEQKDAKGSFALHAYDALGRPTHVWAKDLSSEDVTLRQRIEYGESVSSPKSNNLLGKLYHQFDEAGVETVTSYDFKGNPLTKQRKVISDSEILNVFNNATSDWDVPTYRVDWTGKDETSSILDSTTYQTDMEYDALDRVTKITYPEDVNSNRKVMTPTYNKAGNLHKVDFDGTEYVKEIAYNARGQRLLIAFGNNIMTRYIYDNKTFRLVRQKSEKYTYSFNSTDNTHTYSPQSGTTRQDYAYEYDLVGNIFKLKDRTPNSGIDNTTLGTDALDREFFYDPLYRLIKAKGRESDTQDSSYRWDNAPKTGTPTPQNVRSYTRKYWYDKMGNMEQLKNNATNNTYVRDYIVNTGNNRLDQVKDNQSPANVIADFTWDNAGNMIESDTTRNYEWDHSNQLRAYYNQTGTNEPSVYAHYLYDGSGNRVKKLVRTQGGDYETTVYINDAFEYHYKEKNSNTYEKNYCHIMDDASRIAMIRYGIAFPDDISNTEVYNLEDHLGSSSVRLDTNGAVIDKEEYYPFGDSSLRTFDKKRYRFTGKEKDSESGLYYFGARYYAAWTCRFISVDPMGGKSKNQSPYHYTSNNPINRVDPSGNQDKSAGGEGGSKKSGSSSNKSQNKGKQGTDGQSGGEKPNVHQVEKGDTLWDIAQENDTTVKQIRKNNPHLPEDATNLQPGTKVKLPGKGESTSEKGAWEEGRWTQIKFSNPEPGVAKIDLKYTIGNEGELEPGESRTTLSTTIRFNEEGELINKEGEKIDEITYQVEKVSLDKEGKLSYKYGEVSTDKIGSAYARTIQKSLKEQGKPPYLSNKEVAQTLNKQYEASHSKGESGEEKEIGKAVGDLAELAFKGYPTKKKGPVYIYNIFSKKNTHVNTMSESYRSHYEIQRKKLDRPLLK